MAIWQVKGKGWRYQFEVQKKVYSGQWFKTKGEAKARMGVHKREIKNPAPEMTPITCLSIVNEYMAYAERKFAKKTLEYKRYIFREFFKNFGPDITIDNINTTSLESYLRTRESNIDYNRHRKDLCAMLSWAWKRKLIPENPCFFIEKMPEEKYVRQIPTAEEMSRILLAAGEDRPFILVLYHTMGRVDEILRLRWEDVNFDNREVKLWTRKRKGGGWEFDTIPINQVLFDTLMDLFKKRTQNDYVFINPRTGTRYARRPWLMKRICERAGTRYFTYHAIRHYVASFLMDSKKVSIGKISRLLRHKSLQTTEVYLQLVDPSLKEALEGLE